MLPQFGYIASLFVEALGNAKTFLIGWARGLKTGLLVPRIISISKPAPERGFKRKAVLEGRGFYPKKR